MEASWIKQGIERLAALQYPEGGWGYHYGGFSSVEPTVLSCLAILAWKHLQTGDVARNIVGRGAEWLAGVQHPRGWLGVTAESPGSTWPTPYAVLLWKNLNEFSDASNRAVAWILKLQGKALSRTGIYGHDVTLVGWPWITGTHSWVEPTALAIMALRLSNHTEHPRTRTGIDLVMDRVIDGGGWNYGNTSVFGQILRPQPAPTGMALLALAQLQVCPDAVAKSCSYLRSMLKQIRSPVSLSWGILGLTAWNDRPDKGDKWLEESFSTVQTEGNSTMSLACLLLAASESSFYLFTGE